MTRQSIHISLLAAILGSLLVASIPFTSAARPVISSSWTTSPPVIDGNFAAGEWSNLQITFKSPEYPSSYVLPTYVYFLNDKTNLYVLVDGVGDTTDSDGDECLLVFNFVSPISIKIEGKSGTKITTGFNAAIGFGSSTNGATPHKIYEFSIPFSYINALPGQSIDICSPMWKTGSMPYDPETNRDNIWPQNLNTEDINTWGLLSTQLSRPVAGVLMPANKLAILTPYLALAGLAGALAAIITLRKKQRLETSPLFTSSSRNAQPRKNQPSTTR